MDVVNNILMNLGLTQEATTFIIKTVRISIILIIAYCLIRLSNKNSKFVKKVGAKFNKDNTAGLFASRIVSVIILIVAILIILTELGYNVGTLVTSLGIRRCCYRLNGPRFC